MPLEVWRRREHPEVVKDAEARGVGVEAMDSPVRLDVDPRLLPTAARVPNPVADARGGDPADELGVELGAGERMSTIDLVHRTHWHPRDSIPNCKRSPQTVSH